MRYGQIVLGPAGSGKSTYCSAIAKHGEASKRNIKIVNLDPAAENFDYEPFIDVRELISVEDAMEDEEVRLGPNGGLVFCMEYLAQNLDWLQEQLGEGDDDYLLFDCPGQIELYTHLPVMKEILRCLQRLNFNLCSVFVLDTQFMLEMSKFFAGSLVALSSMISMELPCVNILSKMDLLSKKNRETVEELVDPDSRLLALEETSQSSATWNAKYRKLNEALGQVLDEYSLVVFTTLDITDEESITNALMKIENCIQYGESQEVRDRYPEEMEPGNGKME